jgi:hypothetical protein
VDESPNGDDDPRVSLGVIMLCRSSEVDGIRQALRGTKAKIVITKIASPRRLWIVEADREPPREGRT